MDISQKYENLRDLVKKYLKSGSKDKSQIEKLINTFLKQNKALMTTVCAKHIGARMVSLSIK
jgi:hypothetical protein